MLIFAFMFGILGVNSSPLDSNRARLLDCTALTSIRCLSSELSSARNSGDCTTCAIIGLANSSSVIGLSMRLTVSPSPKKPSLPVR